MAIVIEDNLQPFTYTSDPAYSCHLLSETGSSVSQNDFQLPTSCFFLSAEITNLSPHPQILFMMDVQALYFFFPLINLSKKLTSDELLEVELMDQRVGTSSCVMHASYSGKMTSSCF